MDIYLSRNGHKLVPGNIVDIEDRENFKNSVQEHLINLEE